MFAIVCFCLFSACRVRKPESHVEYIRIIRSTESPLICYSGRLVWAASYTLDHLVAEINKFLCFVGSRSVKLNPRLCVRFSGLDALNDVVN